MDEEDYTETLWAPRETPDRHSSGWIRAGFYMTTLAADIRPEDVWQTQKWCRGRGLKIVLLRQLTSYEMEDFLVLCKHLTDEEFTAEVYARCITGEAQILEV